MNNKERFKDMNDIEQKLDTDRAQRVTYQTLYNDAINFNWFYDYIEQRYPEGTNSNGYNALTEMFVNYHRSLEKQFEKK